MKRLFISASLFLVPLVGHAATIALYDGPDDTPAHTTFTQAAASWAPDNLAGAYTAPRGGISVTEENAFVITNTTGPLSSDNFVAPAIANGDYHTFTLTTPAGVSATNVQITPAYWFQNTHPGIINTRLVVMNSIDGFVSGNQNGIISIPLGVDGTDTAVFTDTFALPDIAANSSMEVRLYFTDGSTSPSRFHRVDSVTVTADLIPEPSAASILGLLGIFGFALRRRR